MPLTSRTVNNATCGASWGKNSTRPESSRKFKKLEKDPFFLVETWYNMKFLELSVFACFRRVFTPN